MTIKTGAWYTYGDSLFQATVNLSIIRKISGDVWGNVIRKQVSIDTVKSKYSIRNNDTLAFRDG